VVRPGILLEQWRVVQECVSADVIVIVQASNTGLSGGSTPACGAYDRAVVILSTTRLNSIFVIEEGRRVICLPGATLDELERRLRPLSREPHSVIGSSCIGASVVGGLCNNSGGALTRSVCGATNAGRISSFALGARLRLSRPNRANSAAGRNSVDVPVVRVAYYNTYRSCYLRKARCPKL
jgi:D-lactate dehydrogenase (quinone)